jgi:hypothetical protein
MQEEERALIINRDPAWIPFFQFRPSSDITSIMQSLVSGLKE